MAKRNPAKHVKSVAKVAPKPKHAVTMDDLHAALSARYPQHTLGSIEAKSIAVSIPGGVFNIDRAKALACATVADLRDYIASLVVR